MIPSSTLLCRTAVSITINALEMAACSAISTHGRRRTHVLRHERTAGVRLLPSGLVICATRCWLRFEKAYPTIESIGTVKIEAAATIKTRAPTHSPRGIASSSKMVAREKHECLGEHQEGWSVSGGVTTTYDITSNCNGNNINTHPARIFPSSHNQ